MAEVLELRRVFCVRDFPKGCGPECVMPDREPTEEAAPPQPHPPSLPAVADSQETTACDAVVTPSAGPFTEAPLVEVDPNLSAINVEPVDGAASVGCLKRQVMDSLMAGAGNSEAAGVKREEEADQAIDNSANEHGKLGLPQLSKKGLEQSNALGVSITDGSSLFHDVVEKRSLRMYPLPRRRAVSAIRDFPIGCGASSPRMGGEQALKHAEVDSLEGKSTIEEKQPMMDPQSMTLQDLSNSEVLADNKTANGTAEMIVVRKIKQEVAEGFRVENEVSKSTIPNPVSKSLEAKNKPLLEKEGTSRESRENQILPRADPDKRLSEKANASLSINPVAQTSKIARSDSLGNKSPSAKSIDNLLAPRADPDKRLSEKANASLSINPVAQTSKIARSDSLGNKSPSAKSIDNLLARSQKVSKITKKKVAGATKGASVSGIGQKLNAENLVANRDKLIIQALMAAPHCPWVQGKKSGASGSRSRKAPIRRKKMEPSTSDIQHTLSSPKLKRQRPVSDMQLSSPKSRRQQAISDMQLALSKVHSEPTTFDLQNALDDDEDFASQYEENELELTAYEGFSELAMSVPPLAAYKKSEELCVPLPPTAPYGWKFSGSDRPEIVARCKVRRVLRLFQVLCRKLLQSEEARSKGSGNIRRVDLTSAQMLKEKGEWVNASKPTIGIVPGVEVGDEFQYRVELSIVGLHRPFQGGIDAVKKDGLNIAASIVASGGYKDDMDSSDVLIYSGSGGNPGGPDKPPEDQKLERGNLALKNSIETKTPVRVIHGTKELKGGSSHNAKPKLLSTFTYAGLYLVDKYWLEKGPHGFSVFKFQLVRMPGQPELAFHEVKRSKKLKVREGLCVKDISDGTEKIPICAINSINTESPPPFKYITKNKYPSSYTKTLPKGCDCTNGCSDTAKCACAVKNGGEIPFNFNGAIVLAKPLVYECGRSCKCPPSCHNRVSQRGIQIPLEIFRTETRGWGVRSLYSIASGSFVCEYIGELLTDKEAEQRTNDEYLFDIGHNYDDHSLWEGLPSFIPDLKSNAPDDTVNDVGFTIDAAEYGNVGRFINHSCSPNLYAQNVLYDHDDKRMPHIMFFAAENIPPLQELTYHYNYTIDEVRDAEGNIKRKDCYCGSHECTGRLY